MLRKFFQFKKMSQANYASQLATLHREIDAEKEKLRQLQTKRDEIRRIEEERNREKNNLIRQAYMHPNSAQQIAELTRTLQTANATYLTEIANINGQIWAIEQKIFAKREECIRLFQH